MHSFLKKIAANYTGQEQDLSRHTFILPSVRAGVFLKDAFRETTHNGFIMPRIIQIDMFIEEISGLKKIDTIDLLFLFYQTYLSVFMRPDSFENFSKWAFSLIQDFNDIDKNLKDAREIFTYLSDAKRIDAFFDLDGKEPPEENKYLQFLAKIPELYTALYSRLTDTKKGYQGILYKEAVQKMQPFLLKNKDKTFVFIGFNALTLSEEKLIRYFLENANAQIFWDIDRFFFKADDPVSEFLRKHRKWPYFDTHDFKWISEDFNTGPEKKIEITGASGAIGQIKYVGTLLSGLSANQNDLKNTAVVLADESLLPVLLNSLPGSVDKVNITMGYALQNTSMATLFHRFFKMHLYKNQMGKGNAFYFADLVAFLNLPEFDHFIDKGRFQKFIQSWTEKNRIWIPKKDIVSLLSDCQMHGKSFSFLFEELYSDVPALLNTTNELIGILKEDPELTTLDVEYLYRFNQLFGKLKALTDTFPYIENLKVLAVFYKQLLQREKLSFKGEPLEGLQIMGMLESRLIDFENVILISANEGILPEGKTQQTFLPFDIKLKYGLATFKEKDAIFAYHFFRLLQRAKRAYLLYNAQIDNFGMGEPSRFIKRIELSVARGELKNVKLKRKTVQTDVITEGKEPVTIVKSREVLDRLDEMARSGFSPSSLTSYIRNPVEFYMQKILKIKQPEDLEEEVAVNTYGTIIHESMEELYKDFKGREVQAEHVAQMQLKVEKVVRHFFLKKFDANNLQTGRNFLKLKVAEKYIKNFLKQEKQEIKRSGPIYIVDLEKKLQFNFYHQGLGKDIVLNGYVDRIDRINDVYRIIDYKTGNVKASDLKIKDWNDLTSDYKWSKAFQVLQYAFMFCGLNQIDPEKQNIEAGIYSFKNMRGGFLKFGGKAVSAADLESFSEQLSGLLTEIFDPNLPFIEKEIKKFKKY